MKRFIIFTDEELDKMKSGQLVVCENCDFSESGDDKPSWTRYSIKARMNYRRDQLVN